jgi:hypothetical protein
MELYYFGTDMRQAGHYFSKLTPNNIDSFGPSIYYKEVFAKIDFDPEDYSPREKFPPVGTVDYFQTKKCSVIRIEGAPADTRRGTKSVFFVFAQLTEDEMWDLIFSIPIAKEVVTFFGIKSKEITNE